MDVSYKKMYHIIPYRNVKNKDLKKGTNLTSDNIVQVFDLSKLT